MGVVQIVSFPGEQHLHNVTHSHAGSSHGATGVYQGGFFGFHRREKGWLCCIDHFGFELRFGKSHTGKNHLLRRYWNPPAASPQGQPSRGLFHRVTLPALPETVSLFEELAIIKP